MPFKGSGSWNSTEASGATCNPTLFNSGRQVVKCRKAWQLRAVPLPGQHPSVYFLANLWLQRHRPRVSEAGLWETFGTVLLETFGTVLLGKDACSQSKATGRCQGLADAPQTPPPPTPKQTSSKQALQLRSGYGGWAFWRRMSNVGSSTLQM